jgi:NADH-quinone oxidoreductase subunit F
MKHITNRITQGQSGPEDLQLLYDVASQIKGKCLCALGDFSTEAVLTGLDRFRGDFEAKVNNH